MDEGRWFSEQSFRIYIDILASSNIGIALNTRGLADTAAWAQSNWVRYVNASNIALSAIPRGPSTAYLKAQPVSRDVDATERVEER
jgi:hypothetical protein